MLDIIRVCDSCFNHATEQEIESILNGIVSILVSFHGEVPKAAILAFSEKISQAKLGNIALRVLWLLFQGVSDELPLRYNVYYHLVQISIETDQVRAIFPGLDTFKKWFSKAPPKTEEMQRLLRLLHKALIQCKESELAAKVMIELLGTYTSENAAAAREDAERCILAAIADPETFLLDPLLSLKPVRVLEKELVYELLLIFISKKLSDYLQFYNKNKDFITKMGLDHDANQKKMRLLTVMQLAEGVSEISFDTITSELQIDESQVEAFVIDLLKTKLVRGRMDQSARKVHISSTMHRTFGPAQWEQLRQTLRAWKSSLATVQEGMTQVVHAQMEMATQRTKVM
ncbi:Eukaryotic translation initiation factor 3 subunit F-1 [Nesidiocoris tenuis]|uniref:Eukaryotic translation initiation factor 3 subunit F-1 n=1 Tax=Nesidiocoris tenuis TaxID=355587 RepID=A0ABN7BDX3_9HEMI|nr:Eukaryotic translation initiation factor 3 subunit F-1 [Nesidiocoris tenuis]